MPDLRLLPILRRYMTKLLISRLKLLLLAAVLCVVTSAPATQVVYAQVTEDICVNLGTDRSVLTNGFDQKAAQLDLALSTESQQVARLLGSTAADITASQRDNDSRITSATEAYRQAQTDSPRVAAVAAYAEAVVQAVAVRRAAYTEAQRVFVSSVQKQQAERQAFLRSIAVAYKDAALAEIAEAQVSCRRSNRDNQAIRSQIREGLRQSKESYRSQVNARSNDTEIEQFVQARNDAFTKARAVFEQSLLDARAALQQT